MGKSGNALPGATVTAVLRRSCRRCCVCFGLRRDDTVKKGRVAHLDGNPGNNALDNLAWMCLEHHYEYDSTTSQTKSLPIQEVKVYRQELHERFHDWSSIATIHYLLNQHLLNCLAASISLDTMLDVAITSASRYRMLPEDLVYEALVETVYDSCDGDNWGPYLALIEDFRYWGWLDFTMEEERSDHVWAVHICVSHKPICKRVLKALERRFPDLVRRNRAGHEAS